MRWADDRRRERLARIEEILSRAGRVHAMTEQTRKRIDRAADAMIWMGIGGALEWVCLMWFCK